MTFTSVATNGGYPANWAGMTSTSLGTLFIEMKFEGQKLSSGTGFIVQSPKGRWYLITNRHNVTGRRQDDGTCLSSTAAIPSEMVIHHHVAGYGSWIEKTETLFDAGNPRWFEHPTLGAKADFVALPLENLGGTSTLSWHMDQGENEQAIGPADPISVVGLPFGISYGGFLPVWATGFVASEPVQDYMGLPVFLIDCRSREGQSGSPVVKHSNGGIINLKNGQSKIGAGVTTTIFGIYSGRINAQSDIGMVWKKAAIMELVNTL